MAKRYLGFGIESSYGSAASSLTYLKAISFDYKGEWTLVKPEALRELTVADADIGKYDVSGSATVQLLTNYTDVGKVLKAAIGTPTSSLVGTTAYQHVFLPYDIDDTVNSATIEVGGEFSPNAIQLLGAVLTELNFKMETNKEITYDFNYVAQKDQTATLSTPTYTANGPATGNDVTVTIGGSAEAKVVSAKINFAVPINTDGGYYLGSQFRQEVPMGSKMWGVSGTLEIVFDDNTYLQKFWGSSSATGPQTSLDTGITQMTITSQGAEIEAGYNYGISFEFPEVYYESLSFSVDANSRIHHTIDFTAIYSDSSSYPFKITLTNSTSSV